MQPKPSRHRPTQRPGSTAPTPFDGKYALAKPPEPKTAAVISTRNPHNQQRAARRTPRSPFPSVAVTPRSKVPQPHPSCGPSMIRGWKKLATRPPPPKRVTRERQGIVCSRSPPYPQPVTAGSTMFPVTFPLVPRPRPTYVLPTQFQGKVPSLLSSQFLDVPADRP